MSRARTLVAQAQASDQRLVSLLAQLQQLQNQVSGQASHQGQYRGATVSREVTPDTAPSQAQIDSLISSLNAEIAFLNQLILELNGLTLTAANEGVANVPNINMQTIAPAHGGARIASGTLP